MLQKKGRIKESAQQNNNYQYGSAILSLLRKVKRIGDGRYTALCPCHDDKSPSLAVTFKPDGVTLIHCFGCGASGLDVCNALGAEPSTLFPPSDSPRYEKQSRHHFDAWQILPALAFDAAVLLIAARRLSTGEPLPEADLEYLAKAVIRIHDAVSYSRRANHGR